MSPPRQSSHPVGSGLLVGSRSRLSLSTQFVVREPPRFSRRVRRIANFWRRCNVRRRPAVLAETYPAKRGCFCWREPLARNIRSPVLRLGQGTKQEASAPYRRSPTPTAAVVFELRRSVNRVVALQHPDDAQMPEIPRDLAVLDRVFARFDDGFQHDSRVRIAREDARSHGRHLTRHHTCVEEQQHDAGRYRCGQPLQR